MTPSRAAALDALNATLTGRATLDRAFERAVDTRRLEGPDRAFVRALLGVTLRRLGEIDAAVKPLLQKPLPNRATRARDILRLGAAQLMFLETAPHAAVAETVALANGDVEGYRGLINAVLRRMTREPPAAPTPDNAARLNTPGWLWESWRAAYGHELTAKIAAAHQAEPPLDLTIFKGEAAEWAERLGGVALPNGTVRLRDAGAIPMLAGFGDGAWAPQDAAASAPARLLGDVSGKDVVDLCAAPGGKTAQLAANGARVIAVEVQRARVGRLAENLDRLRLTSEIAVADGTEWRPPSPADAVLLDVPCSATGTIRRHPDVAWTKSTAEVRALKPLQAALLDNAARMLKPGGLMVYACCSLQPEEGEQQIEAFLKRNKGFRRKPLRRADLHGLPTAALTAAGDLRTLPAMWSDKGGMDGFYAARLMKLPK